ncbi:hypothetical protein A2803_01695 [Candidatus Woesebacteria bacterium RIFCSPHIGHO2_01_FULL_44_21]|uniref:Response regulatory domain-containing protein n=1 Tax=Candidatus Woesebacteria bacterium RIFCSPHIGHO2_01_FULL_44_21 TaxID=1802503 RepID=A0A1F7YW79_9BACT|nr:MAG: hypothetical protein A2803_01695 [Candidatus Woesebacteria bacterium RIFCSPHIGHO2_01_FULL_44_21]OGM69586.1 MAG: hypothetical protein A2897_03210 [Candidatus Woesebacteria bacterium RIFCSPLOWO2_01_FULL_44_24b]
MKKILVVEDDKFLANAYMVKLAKENFEVKLARNGEEALAVFTEFKPDLMLLDLVMPKKDGFEVLEQLKGKTRVPILIASNLGQKEDIDRGMSLGAADFVVKSEMPISNVVEKIKKLLHVS